MIKIPRKMTYTPKLFRKKTSENHDFWMSYTDLMSGFLVVFMIISIVVYQQYSESKRSFDKLFETYKGLNVEQISEKIVQMTHELDSIKGANLKNLIFEYQDVFVSNDFVKVDFDSLRGSIILTCQDSRKYLFASGSQTFEPELKDYLEKVHKSMVEKTMNLWRDYKYSNVELRIEGHTDPNGISKGCVRGSDQSFLENLELSSKRANRVYDYILNSTELTIEQKDFVKKNMISVGYSFSKRVYDNNIENVGLDPTSRRIEFRIISK